MSTVCAGRQASRLNNQTEMIFLHSLVTLDYKQALSTLGGVLCPNQLLVE